MFSIRQKRHIYKIYILGLIGLLSVQDSVAQQHIIGWQTFENSRAGNNNSGIQDDTPDSNSTYDPTPMGSSFGNLYLTGSIGLNASGEGWGGLGQATNKDFLNGGTFGASLAITSATLADGSPGVRIGPFGNPPPNGEANGGTSSWKFVDSGNVNQLKGDFSITNHSDYHFELGAIHFDARGLANPTTSPNTLELRYLATPGELINATSDSEVADLTLLYTNTWTARGVENISLVLEPIIGSVSRIPPGKKASFRFVWSGNTGGGNAQIDNVAFSGVFKDQNNGFVSIDPTDDPRPIPEGPNIIVMIPDDQRWDATSFMQDSIESRGRVARFPWLSNPVKQTPNMDRLSSEGIHFNNAFVVYSICSPSRATMLTGQYPHLHRVTDNHTHFPATATTYATLLQETGYATGYFGKWHMGTQKNRPGFDTAVSFEGQGTYFNTEFFDESGRSLFTSSESDWVDDVSTEQAKKFITAQHAAGRPSLTVLGFKTPHQPWTPPARNRGLFSSDTAVAVPNLSVPPPFAPRANGGSSQSQLRDYMRTVVGIDQNVGDILAHLDDLQIADNTAVIFISDNGFFRGEHRLGDKRSAYEESLRIPLMIRYPAGQSKPLAVDPIALNVDVAPTILELAGVPVPESMQGRSLVPLMTGSTPSDWRDSFIFSYNIDPEFPAAAVVPHLGLRRADGLKLVNYSDDSSWNELYDASRDGDPYEINNLYSLPERADDLAAMKRELVQTTERLGFMKASGFSMKPQGASWSVQGADASLFKIETSSDLIDWKVVGTFEGGGTPTRLSLPVPGFSSSEVIEGNASDYVLAEGSPVTAIRGFETLRVGSIPSAGGRDAVLIFELPVLGNGMEIALAELELHVVRTFAQWDADLWVLGIKDDTTPILEYSETPTGNPAVLKLEDAIFDYSTSNSGETVTSNPLSGITQYLQNFYEENSSYAGGKYLFLRVNSTADIGVNDQRYAVTAAENPNIENRPKLNLFYRPLGSSPRKQSFRVRYGRIGP